MNAKKMNKMLKSAVTALSIVLVICLTVAGTITYLQDKTDPVVNTFTSSDVSITLTETKPTGNTAQMVPGLEIEKDPTVTVKANSEKCYVFVKVEAKNGVALEGASDNTDYITYALADGWTELKDGVYYREVAKAAADQEFHVLKNNKVTVLPSVTKAMMETVKNDATKEPTLTFTAYAIQFDHLPEGTGPAGAWEMMNSPASNG